MSLLLIQKGQKYALTTGHMPLGGLLQDTVAWVVDCPDMTLAVDCAIKLWMCLEYQYKKKLPHEMIVAWR